MKRLQHVPAVEPRTIVDILLLAVALIGVCFAYPAATRFQSVAAEYNRLENQVGDLRIDDPTKVVIRAIDTGEPLHYAWRIYLPANYAAHWRSSHGGNSSFSSEPRDFTARVRFRRNEQGKLMVFAKSSGGSSLMSINHPVFGTLSDDQLQQIEFVQLGRDRLQVVEPSVIVTLLELSLSPELQQQVVTQYQGRRLLRDLPVLWRWQLGPEASFEDAY
jgi:hypothetical protein